jgi:hypothetical protein
MLLSQSHLLVKLYLCELLQEYSRKGVGTGWENMAYTYLEDYYYVNMPT